MSVSKTPHSVAASRRLVMLGAGATGLAGLVAGATHVFASPRGLASSILGTAPICRIADVGPAIIAPAGTKLKLTWNANAICTVGVPVAMQHGLFAKHGLDVELVNFGGSTDQLLEAISTGKADAGVGMALRWLKPLEQGFDVKIAMALHGGCMRLFATNDSGISTIENLKGKIVGTSDMASPEKNFFSIVAAKQGMDPNSDIEWRQYPADLLGVALKKGEIQAFALGDPLGWVIRERDGLHEVANNLSGEYHDRVCCVLGVAGKLVRDRRDVAGALVQALTEAQVYVASDPDGAAALFAQYSPTPTAMLSAMLHSHTHGDHPTGDRLKNQIAAYADDLKLVKVLRPGTDSQRFANKVFTDVLSS